LGALELAISIALLFTIDPNATDESLIPTRVAILSGYVVFASIVTIIMGFASFKNMTDRFMWVVNGMVGAVLAVLMFGGASAANDTTAAYFCAKVLLFGTYLMVNGITYLFFGIHSRDEIKTLHEERAEHRKLLSRKTKKSVKKGSK
jgi:hypothetical protein